MSTACALSQLTTMCNERNLKLQASDQYRQEQGAQQKRQGCSNKRQQARDVRRALIHTAIDLERPQRARGLMHAPSSEGNSDTAEHVSSTTHQASNHLGGTLGQPQCRVQQKCQCWCERASLDQASQSQECDLVCSLAGKILVWPSDCIAPQAHKLLKLGLCVTFCMTACAPSHKGQLQAAPEHQGVSLRADVQAYCTSRCEQQARGHSRPEGCSVAKCCRVQMRYTGSKQRAARAQRAIAMLQHPAALHGMLATRGLFCGRLWQQTHVSAWAASSGTLTTRGLMPLPLGWSLRRWA